MDFSSTRNTKKLTYGFFSINYSLVMLSGNTLKIPFSESSLRTGSTLAASVISAPEAMCALNGVAWRGASPDFHHSLWPFKCQFILRPSRS